MGYSSSGPWNTWVDPKSCHSSPTFGGRGAPGDMPIFGNRLTGFVVLYGIGAIRLKQATFFSNHVRVCCSLLWNFSEFVATLSPSVGGYRHSRSALWQCTYE